MMIDSFMDVDDFTFLKKKELIKSATLSKDAQETTLVTLDFSFRRVTIQRLAAGSLKNQISGAKDPHWQVLYRRGHDDDRFETMVFRYYITNVQTSLTDGIVTVEMQVQIPENIGKITKRLFKEDEEINVIVETMVDNRYPIKDPARVNRSSTRLVYVPLKPEGVKHG